LNAAAVPSVQKRFAHSVEEAEFDIHPYQLHILEEGPAEKATLTRKDGLSHYKELVTKHINRLELKIEMAYKNYNSAYLWRLIKQTLAFLKILEKCANGWHVKLQF
jgi:pantothenate kinase-related protein Tda10